MPAARRRRVVAAAGAAVVATVTWLVAGAPRHSEEYVAEIAREELVLAPESSPRGERTAPPLPPPPRGCVLAVAPGSMRSAGEGDGGFVGSERPLLSWQLAFADSPAGEAARRITALSAPSAHRRPGGFRVVASGGGSAAGCAAEGACLWDSGRVEGEALSVEWGGPPLRPAARVVWRVGVWDARGQWCGWGPESAFEVTLLRPADWGGAQWIRGPRFGERDPGNCHLFDDGGRAAAPLLRTEFRVPGVSRARLYAAGLGYADLELDGETVVAPGRLWPSWTRYDRRVYFSTSNVTAQVARCAPRGCAVGALLGNGWWNLAPLRFWGRVNFREALPSGAAPVLKLLLRVWAPDGAVHDVVSSPAWLGAPSHILRNDLFLGEVHDGAARRALEGWSAYGFDAAGWQPAARAEGPLGRLEAERLPPAGPLEEIRPESATVLPRGNAVILDFGRNFAGSCAVTLKRQRGGGQAGGRLVLRYAELLRSDGALNPLSSVAGQMKRCDPGGCKAQPCLLEQTDTYIIAGGGEEERFEPRFSWKGFRYIEVAGWPEWATESAGELAAAVRDGVVCWPVMNRLERVGTVATSEPVLDALLDMARHSFESNLLGVQSDCPHREKLGYTGDQLGVAEALISVFDMSRFHDKAISDVCDAQRGDGGLTETAPFVGIADNGLGGMSGPIGWQAWGPLGLRWHRQYYGTMPAERAARAGRCVHRMAEQLARRAAQSRVEDGLGDWMSLEPKPLSMTGRAWQALSYAAAAEASQSNATREVYSARAARVVADLNGRMLDLGSGVYSGWSRNRDTGQMYNWRETQAGQGLGLAAGLLPDPRAALRAGRALVRSLDGACRHLRTGLWGVKWVLLALGGLGLNALALDILMRTSFPSFRFMQKEGATTLWEGWESSDFYSHNHGMLGSYVQWALQSLAGIRPHPAAVGFDRVIVNPQPPPQLRHAAATYRSQRGAVHVAWRWGGDHREWLGGPPRPFHFNVSLPPGVRAQIWVPASAPPLLLDGAPTEAEWDSGAQVFRLSVAGGGDLRLQSLYSGGPAPGIPAPDWTPPPQPPDGELLLHERPPRSRVLQVPFSSFVPTRCSGTRESALGWDLCGVQPPSFPGGGAVRGAVAAVSIRGCERCKVHWASHCHVPRTSQPARPFRRAAGSVMERDGEVPLERVGSALGFELEMT